MSAQVDQSNGLDKEITAGGQGRSDQEVEENANWVGIYALMLLGAVLVGVFFGINTPLFFK